MPSVLFPCPSILALIPLKSLIRGKDALIRRSRNSYILSLRSVTFTPIGVPFRSLKFEMSLRDIVAIAFCPVMVDISVIAFSTIFLSATA